jgi:inner membrane transporter RhtA
VARSRTSAGAPEGVATLTSVHPVALLVAGMVSLQFGTALGTAAAARLGVAGLLTIRQAAAAVILLALWRPWRVRAPALGYVQAAVLGLVLGTTSVLFYSAAQRLPLGAAVTIEYLGPVTVAVVASRRPSHLLWAVMAIGGVVILTAPWNAAGALDGVGIACALGSAVLWAAYIVLVPRVGRFFDKSIGLAVAMVFAAAVPIIPGVLEAGHRMLEPDMLAVGCFAGVVCSVVPFSLEMDVLRRMSTRVFGVLMALQPAVAALAGWAVLGQQLSARGIVAIMIVASAGAGATSDTYRSAARP